jgi:hypothetical protein
MKELSMVKNTKMLTRGGALSMPDISVGRPEKIRQAKKDVLNPKYPPNDLLERIAKLFVREFLYDKSQSEG